MKPHNTKPARSQPDAVLKLRASLQQCRDELLRLREQVKQLKGFVQHGPECQLKGEPWMSASAPECSCGLALAMAGK
jgi:hypothetical protein